MAVVLSITNARYGDYNIENNNEVQRLTFTVKRTSGTTFWQDKKTLIFGLTHYNDDGTTTTLTQTVQFDFPSGSVGATKSTYVDFLVPHKTDGTQNITYEASIATGTSVGTLNPTGSATLETIPRASSITVNDANIGSATNIVINKASANFTTSLYYVLPGQSEWIPIVSKTSNQVYGWTVPTSFYSLIPNSKTIQCTFIAETYSNDNYIGTSRTTATFTATGNPIINSKSAIVTDEGSLLLTGVDNKVIKYISNVNITVNASAQNNASLTSIKVNGIEAANNIVTINNCDTNVFNIVVIDSRGYTTNDTITLDLVDYFRRTLNADIKKNNPTDGIVNISYEGNFFNGNFGDYQNQISVDYRFVEKGQDINQEAWQSLNPVIDGNNYSQSNYQINGFDYRKQYEFQIRAYDQVGTTQINGILIKKGIPTYWWNDNGLYVNGLLTSPQLNNLYGTSINNTDYNDMTTTGIYYMTTGCNNAPEDYCYLLVMSTGSYDLIQICVSVSTLNFYFRTRNGTTWSTWQLLIKS